MFIPEKQELCSNCVNPLGMGVMSPLTKKELRFHEVEGRILCEICTEFLSPVYFPEKNHFRLELENYLDTHERVLMAYSGGMDSTVTLAFLLKECKKRNIRLETFTIETGAKGRITKCNIDNVMNFFGIKDHFFLDVSSKIQDDPKVLAVTEKPMTTLEVYRYCRGKDILPCGKLCNTMVDGAYDDVMKRKGFSEMFTGGDTPKKNATGNYSIFWRKPSGVVIIRGGFAFGLTKEKNRQFIEQNNIPWVNPGCGGYDTDCLVPGMFFANVTDGKSEMALGEVVEKYPIILEYLTERVRFGVIDRKIGINMLVHIDIANLPSYIELDRILRSM